MGNLPQPLQIDPNNPQVIMKDGVTYPIINGVIRFINNDNYASSFGLQWNTYRLTQLDSYTGLSISKDRLTRLAGGSLDIFKGKNVLEAGCGAGRFTEIMLESGANVFAIDLSSAVEANYANCKNYENYIIAQANILDIPISPQQFDIVVCIGVIQHTPNPEETMNALCAHVKPGGLLIIDHYTEAYPITFSRSVIRALLIRLPSALSLRLSHLLVVSLWPFHRLMWRLRRTRFHRIVTPIHKWFLKLSPVVDYHAAYAQLGKDLLRIWAILDTHDTLTDFYKHLRSKEEIEAHLKQCGMVDIDTSYGGNGVEARATKPVSTNTVGNQ